MVLSSNGLFGVEVLVGGEVQPEFAPVVGAPSCDAFCETDFFSAVSYRMATTERDPYGEEYEQRWPVTPFTLRLTNHYDEGVAAKVYLDGKQACSKRIGANASIVADAINATPGRHRSESRSMIFARPRPLARGESAAQHDDLESIRVSFHHVVDNGKSLAYVNYQPQQAYMGANKGAAKDKAGSMTRAGGVMRPAFTGAYRRRTYNIVPKTLDSLRICYGEKTKLKILGVYSTAPKMRRRAGASNRPKPPKKQRQAAGGAEPKLEKQVDDDVVEITAEEAGAVPDRAVARLPMRGHYVQLTVRDAQDNRQTFRMLSSDPWSKLYSCYAAKLGVEASKPLLLLDGETLAPASTPAAEDLEAGDEVVIDAKFASRPSYQSTLIGMRKSQQAIPHVGARVNVDFEDQTYDGTVQNVNVHADRFRFRVAFDDGEEHTIDSTTHTWAVLEPAPGGAQPPPAVGDRVSVDFTDQIYEGVVLEVKPPKAGRYRFRVLFDADGEKVSTPWCTPHEPMMHTTSIAFIKVKWN
jgi:hypothetical protein